MNITFFLKWKKYDVKCKWVIFFFSIQDWSWVVGGPKFCTMIFVVLMIWYFFCAEAYQSELTVLGIFRSNGGLFWQKKFGVLVLVQHVHKNYHTRHFKIHSIEPIKNNYCCFFSLQTILQNQKLIIWLSDSDENWAKNCQKKAKMHLESSDCYFVKWLVHSGLNYLFLVWKTFFFFNYGIFLTSKYFSGGIFFKKSLETE